MRRTLLPFLLLGVLSGPGVAEEIPLPFSMPIPEGWRTETIPFPLEFAPDLPYEGLEELRFSPGMFDAESEEFWSYAFIWWVAPDAQRDAESLSRHLETYFRGLAGAVAGSREISVGDAGFSASIEVATGGDFRGVAETFDAFVTEGEIRLHVAGGPTRCEAQNRQAIFFLLSPQDFDHEVWTTLNTIREGFRCGSAAQPN